MQRSEVHSPAGSDPSESDFEALTDDEQVNEQSQQTGEGSEESEDEPEAHSDDSDDSVQDYDYTRKDPGEVELEKLVFGDSAGFRSALQDFKKPVPPDDDIPQQQADERLTAIPDNDLFFIDEGPDAALAPKEPGNLQDVSDEDEDQRAAPAWEDSDDERLQISLMSVPRLRKLRNFEGEDVISGREYQQRLRRQYRALHPPPKWAAWRPVNGTNERPKKRRKITAIGEEADEADLDSGSDVSMEDTEMTSAPSLTDILRSSHSLTRKKTRTLSQHTTRPRLKPEVLDIDRLPDIVPSSCPQPHATTSLSLHPTLPLLISAGLSGMLYMHHLAPFPTPPDPPNPLITSLHLKNTRLSMATFSPLAATPSDPKIYMAGNRRNFHTWTLPTGAISKTDRIGDAPQGKPQQRVRVLKPSPCGRYIAILGASKKGGGVVNVLSASTTQWVAQARGEGRGGLADFSWWGDGEGLSLVGKLGEVAEWSCEERRVVLRWQDQGGVGVTVMALGADGEGVMGAGGTKKKGRRIGPDRWAVLGTNMGFVTVYDRSTLLNETSTQNSDPTSAPILLTPSPHATLTQLTTPISHLSISPCGQLLAMASKWKRDALRLVHLASGTVYRNWPTDRTPLGRISSMVLGECEGVVQGGEEGRRMVLVVGNEQGVVRGWVVRG